MQSRGISYLFCLLFFILTSFNSRKALVIDLVGQAKRILPENWFLVQTDSSFTVYFCETALDLPVTSEGVFVPNEDLYGEQFWGAPWPDSVHVVEFDSSNAWKKGTKYKKPGRGFLLNAILRIDVLIGNQFDDENSFSIDHFPVAIKKSVPVTSTIQFEENRKPRDRYYRENGLTLQAEYERLVLNLNFMLGLKHLD